MTSEPSASRPFLVVAIDGGAASGKSSTARELARRFDLLHVDTGSHYRTLALACLEAGLPPEDTPRLRGFLAGLHLDTRLQGRESRLAIGGQPPPPPAALRSERVNQAVSLYAAIPALRHAVMAYQRGQVELARKAGFAGLVMEGRDIGTVILPDAGLKVFLTATAATRQHRRAAEGSSETVALRDQVDSARATAPLRPAPDAVVIDNSRLPLEAVVDRIAALLPRPA